MGFCPLHKQRLDPPLILVGLCVFQGGLPLQQHTSQTVKSLETKHISNFCSIRLCEPARADVLSVCTILLSGLAECFDALFFNPLAAS